MKGKCLISFEVSHENAPVSVRERFSFTETEQAGLLKDLNQSLDEVFVLSTCNRFSVYTYTDNAEPLLSYFKMFGDVMSYLEITTTQEDTVRKLFETSAGLRSKILGEHEIMAQIKGAYELAKSANTLGPSLDVLIRSALTLGKKVRTNTSIGKCANSYAGVSLSVAKGMLGELAGRSAMIIGTGKMAMAIAYAFKKQGLDEIYVASHDVDRAIEFGSKFSGIPILIGDVHKYLPGSDIVIGSTHGEVSLINEPNNSTCQRGQFGFLNDRPRLFVDLGMPRNFNEALNQIPSVTLLNVDTLNVESDLSIKRRTEAVPEVSALINTEMGRFAKEHDLLIHNDAFGAYWRKLEGIKEDRLNWLLPKLGDVSQEQQDLLERFAQHMIRDLSRDVFKEIKSEKDRDIQVHKIQSMLSINNINLK